jgi:hypothetical protein
MNEEVDALKFWVDEANKRGNVVIGLQSDLQEQRAAWDNLKDAYDLVSGRLMRLQDWLRVARSGALGDHLVRCTWSQIADDIEFHVYPERSNDGQADAGREDGEQAEAGTGVGPGPAVTVGKADGQLACHCYNHEALGHVGWCPTIRFA